MHPSAPAQMGLCIERYMKKERHYRVLDFGSGTSPQQTLTHRDLLRDYDVDYVGTDIREGNNIDLVMQKPYRIPVKSRSVDIVISGQVFEHIPFMWASLLEVARVMIPGGYFFMTVPSRGHTHSRVRLLAHLPRRHPRHGPWSRLHLLEAFTDFPPPIKEPGRRRKKHDFSKIDTENYYWGDSAGVFRKPMGYPALRAAVLRRVILMWANRIGDLELVPEPKRKKGRKDILGLARPEDPPRARTRTRGTERVSELLDPPGPFLPK
jgi:SAM-dependent methyltransferase